DPSVIPVAEEVSPNEYLYFLYSHLLCVIAVVEKFRLHSGPHTLTACIIMAAPSCTVHALVDVVLPDGLSVGLTGILCPTVTVDDRSFQCGICSQGIFQCLDTQICFHVCSHLQTEAAKIKAVENSRYVQFPIARRDLRDICNTFF